MFWVANCHISILVVYRILLESKQSHICGYNICGYIQLYFIDYYKM